MVIEPQLYALLERARKSPHGVRVEVTDVEVFKRRFYAARKALVEDGQIGYETMACRTSPDHKETEIWLTHQRTPYNGKSE